MTETRKAKFATILGIATLAILAGGGQRCHAEEVYSLRQIVAAKDNWSLWAGTETEFVIQGHIGSLTNNEIHMRHCRELRFFKKTATELPRRKSGETMIKMTGRFKLQEKTPIFEVDKVESTSSFVQQHRLRSVSMNFRDPAEWRKLAASTHAEAVFNKSEELHSLARKAFEEACRVERAAKKKVTDDDMTGWIAQMRKFGIGAEVLDLWEHDRLWMKWRSVKRNKEGEAILRFANELATSFPESRNPLETPQPKLEESYLEDPQELFSQSDEDRRQRLLRLFYMNVTRIEILMNADPQGRNADTIVERLRATLPDDPELINRYEDLWISWRFSNIPQASRESAIELSREFRERKLPERARETLEVWLKARLENWRKEGARGLVRAAEEYTSLLEDDKTAHELLLKAWALAPGEEDTQTALERLGYRLHADQWITEKEFNKLPPDPVEEAIKQGEILLWMTAGDVKRAKGPPTEIRTSVAATQVSQAWIYGDPGTVRQVVHLVRSSRQPADKAVVIATGDLRPPARAVKQETAEEEAEQE